MTSISIRELHENTDLWVRKATEQEPIVVTDDGQAVAKIIPIPVAKTGNPFLNRKLLPGFAELQARMTGGTDSAQKDDGLEWLREIRREISAEFDHDQTRIGDYLREREKEYGSRVAQVPVSGAS